MWFDISRPLRELRGDLEKKLKTSLKNYRFVLQEEENLYDSTVLEQGQERVAQFSIEITWESSGRAGKINILDVKEMVPDSDTEDTVTPKEVRDVEEDNTAVTPESLRPPPTSPFIPPPRKPNPMRKLMFDIFDEDEDSITATSPTSTASPASPPLSRRGSKRQRTVSPVPSPPSSPPSSTSWKMKIRLPRNGEDEYTILQNVSFLIFLRSVLFLYRIYMWTFHLRLASLSELGK